MKEPVNAVYRVPVSERTDGEREAHREGGATLFSEGRTKEAEASRGQDQSQNSHKTLSPHGASRPGPDTPPPKEALSDFGMKSERRRVDVVEA